MVVMTDQQRQQSVCKAVTGVRAFGVVTCGQRVGQVEGQVNGDKRVEA